MDKADHNPEATLPEGFTLQEAMDHYVELRNTTIMALSLLTGAIAKQCDAGALKRGLALPPDLAQALGDHGAQFLDAFLEPMRDSAGAVEEIQKQVGKKGSRH